MSCYMMTRSNGQSEKVMHIHLAISTEKTTTVISPRICEDASAGKDLRGEIVLLCYTFVEEALLFAMPFVEKLFLIHRCSATMMTGKVDYKRL